MPPRTRRRWPRVLAVVLVVLVIALLVVDQVVRVKAQSVASAEITSRLDASVPVEVHLSDWPFLLSVARDRMGSVELSMGPGTVHVGSREVPVQAGQLSAHDLTPIRNLADASIGSADASVVISWATLTRLTGVQLSFAADNRVGAQTTFSVLGTQVQANVVAGLALADGSGQLALVNPSAEVAGVQVPGEIVAGAASRLKSRLVLPALPRGLSYSSVAVDSRGATVQVHAGQLVLAQLR